MKMRRVIDFPFFECGFKTAASSDASLLPSTTENRREIAPLFFLPLAKAGRQICRVSGTGHERAKGAEVLPTHTPALFDVAVRRASELLRAGDVVALPTETVYGLAANALDARAVGKLFEIKERPACNPVIVHVAGRGMAQRCTRDWPATADKLASAFWPGPLTIVLARAPNIPDIVTAGGETVGVRWPGHPLIQAVIRECGFPLAAPSANLSSRISPTTAEHVWKILGRKIRLIVDGGQSQVGIESTVLDLTGPLPRVLRPGMIHEQSLRAVIGEVAGAQSQSTSRVPLEPPRSPGQLPKHYSPKATLVLWSWRDDADLRSQLSALRPRPRRVHIIAHGQIPAGEGLATVSVIPHDAEAFARAIYGELHRCDEEGADLIVVEALPEGPEWRGIADRLRRAAG
jgi:L-threonylcarbamoyladenylate synthase